MRYIFVLMAVLFVWSGSATLEAQVDISINIGSQPVWGPTGYDYAEYYYIPDIDVYYYVPLHRFYYYHNRSWIYSSYLPTSYGRFDLYNCHKVVINERDPWRNNDRYRNEYSSFKGRHDQSPIRDSKDSKYFVNKNHPQHNAWVQQQKQSKGNTNIQGRGNVKPQGNPMVRQNNGNKGNTIIQNKGNNRQQGNPVVRQNNGNKGNATIQNKGNNRQQGNPVVRQNNGNKGNAIIQNKGNNRQQGNPVVRQNNGNKGNSGNKGNGGNNGNGGKKENGNDKGNGKGK